eukprot:13138117-Alexandrium_andersonii.AAC.1
MVKAPAPVRERSRSRRRAGYGRRRRTREVVGRPGAQDTNAKFAAAERAKLKGGTAPKFGDARRAQRQRPNIRSAAHWSTRGQSPQQDMERALCTP